MRSQASAWYNQAWSLLQKADRTPDETLDLVGLAQASFAAWLAVPGHTPTNESIGAWMVSRAFATAGEGRLAEAWARRALAAAAPPSVDPFYRAYAREALARALRVQGRPDEVLAEVKLAHFALAGTAEDDLEALSRDLAELEAQPNSERFYQVSVHRPRGQFTEQVVASMHRYGAAARTQTGLHEVRTLKSDEGTALIGYAVWESRAAKEAANPALRAAVAGDDFEAWEETEIEGWGLDSV